MALLYVLDQLTPLDAFIMDLISYFNLRLSGKPMPKNYLGHFQPVVNIVELWYATDLDNDKDEQALEKYRGTFCAQLKLTMEGRLEPYGDLLNELGYSQVKGSVEKLCGAFRKVLEKSFKGNQELYGGNYPENSIQDSFLKSKVLLKDNYWTKVYTQNPELAYTWRPDLKFATSAQS